VNDFSRHVGDPATEPSDVVFLHARAYERGYVLDLITAEQGVESQFTIRWETLPDRSNWTPHDAVEYFIHRTLDRVVEIVGDRDFVLYLDCLRADCDVMHLYSRAILTAAGYL